MAKILITGGTGLVGTRLTQLLLAKGHTVVYLGRKGKEKPKAKVEIYHWNVEKGEIDPTAFTGVDAVVHLAGAGIADKRWTDERKKEILDSRIKSAALLHKTLSTIKHSIKTFASATAVGYYGDCGTEQITETLAPGSDFLAAVCKKWEAAADKFESLNLRVTKIRIGFVMAKEGGALPQLAMPLNFGTAPYFSKKPLIYPWVHIDDVCGIFLHALENEGIRGVYNAVGNKPTELKDLMIAIKKAKKSHAVLLPTPPFAIRLALGEMAELLLGSQNCSNEKVKKAGYKFKFNSLEEALADIYK
jgi:uncharacterized protein (TIGR01777 family)